jgi:hypothetical protein
MVTHDTTDTDSDTPAAELQVLQSCDLTWKDLAHGCCCFMSAAFASPAVASASLLANGAGGQEWHKGLVVELHVLIGGTPTDTACTYILCDRAYSP